MIMIHIGDRDKITMVHEQRERERDGRWKRGQSADTIRR
jgi:hypothetical protein